MMALHEMLERGEFSLAVREGQALIRQYGPDPVVERIMLAAIQAELRLLTGMKRIAAAATYRRNLADLPDIAAAMDEIVRVGLAGLRITSQSHARSILDGLPGLRHSIGELPELGLLEARALHRLGRFDEARAEYRRWMAGAGPSHSLWPRAVSGLRQAERQLPP